MIYRFFKTHIFNRNHPKNYGIKKFSSAKKRTSTSRINKKTRHFLSFLKCRQNGMQNYKKQKTHTNN